MTETSECSRAKGWSRLSEAKSTTIWQDATEFPLLTVSASALEKNIASMASYAASLGVRLAPHGKTTMSPEIANMQLAAGAWALTVGTPFQLRVFRDCGMSRLILANQLVEPTTISWLHRELDNDEAFECSVFVDSPEGARLLADASAIHPIDVFIEIGHRAGRTGTRTIEQTREVLRVLHELSGVRVVGLGAYEGTLGGDVSQKTLDATRNFARSIGELSGQLRDEKLLAQESLVTIGGSAFFDEAVAGLTTGGLSPEDIVLRSGAYVVHDDVFYSRMTRRHRESAAAPLFEPALTVWAPVLSRPEPELALLLCGRRDVGSDQGLPVVRSVRSRDGSRRRGLGATATSLADQHLFLAIDGDADVEVGDIVELGISHPCTTLDKWRMVPVIDENQTIEATIRTYFS